MENTNRPRWRYAADGRPMGEFEHGMLKGMMDWQAAIEAKAQMRERVFPIQIKWYADIGSNHLSSGPFQISGIDALLCSHE